MNASTLTNFQPEHYVLAKSEKDISIIQSLYNLTLVSATATKAACHPGWPEASLSIIEIGVAVYCFRRLVKADRAFEYWTWLSVCTASFSSLISIWWMIGFGIVQSEKATGGWLSTTAWTYYVCLGAELYSYKGFTRRCGESLLVVAFLQCIGALCLIIQRWRGDVGSVAYMISNTYDCVPQNGFAYLESGVRSRAFRIFQTASYINAIWALFHALGNTEGNLRRSGSTTEIFTLTFSVYFLLIMVPELIYTIIIATQGRPVVISGSCMLVELDVKWGFLDSEISALWKVLISWVGAG